LSVWGRDIPLSVSGVYSPKAADEDWVHIMKITSQKIEIEHFNDW
jgi:hypothetical protein